jgi:integrase/recombinase XerC
MRRRSLKPPLWERQVRQTIQKVKSKSKSRALKSCDLYECVCIFISDHLRERIFSQASLCGYYRHLKSFSAWMSENEKVTDIRTIQVSHLRKYFSYLESERKYKKSSLEGVQTSLMRFFRSMRFRKLIPKNPMKDFHILAPRHMNSANLLTVFDIKIFLRSVKDHYRYLSDSGKLGCFSLFIHRRDLCIVALCIACGLRRGEIQRIKRDHVDFNQKTILIPGKGNQRVIIKERKAFFSHPFLVEILLRYHRLREKLSGDSFFCNCYGDELSATAITQIFIRYSAFISGDVQYNTAIIRKSFSSHLVRKKVNIEAIRDLLGHENCETTLRYYVHFSTEDLAKIWKESNPYGDRN